MDYIKNGVEAIIEDDVTSRFQAEELKNWNLLTRTNRRYEFISWRLTVIWVCGFFVRYIVLMPIRVFTCFLGVSILLDTKYMTLLNLFITFVFRLCGLHYAPQLLDALKKAQQNDGWLRKYPFNVLVCCPVLCRLLQRITIYKIGLVVQVFV